MTAPNKNGPAKKADDKAKGDAKPCELCWPDGWPSEDTHSACCEHGTWSRDAS